MQLTLFLLFFRLLEFFLIFETIIVRLLSNHLKIINLLFIVTSCLVNNDLNTIFINVIHQDKYAYCVDNISEIFFCSNFD